MAARRAAEKRGVVGIMDGIYLELLIVLGTGCLGRGGCDECKTTCADGFNSWECVQLYEIRGEAQMLSTYVVPNTSKLV